MYKKPNPNTNISSDLIASFLVNFEFVGFLTNIKVNINNQKINNISHPIIAACKKSFIIYLNYSIYLLLIEKFISDSFFVYNTDDNLLLKKILLLD